MLDNVVLIPILLIMIGVSYQIWLTIQWNSKGCNEAKNSGYVLISQYNNSCGGEFNYTYTGTEREICESNYQGVLSIENSKTIVFDLAFVMIIVSLLISCVNLMIFLKYGYKYVVQFINLILTLPFAIMMTIISLNKYTFIPKPGCYIISEHQTIDKSNIFIMFSFTPFVLLIVWFVFSQNCLSKLEKTQFEIENQRKIESLKLDLSKVNDIDLVKNNIVFALISNINPYSNYDDYIRILQESYNVDSEEAFKLLSSSGRFKIEPITSSDVGYLHIQLRYDIDLLIFLLQLVVYSIVLIIGLSSTINLSGVISIIVLLSISFIYEIYKILKLRVIRLSKIKFLIISSFKFANFYL